jgi:hypothetical protein
MWPPERDAQGAWTIQPAELHRVYPPLPHGTATAEPVQTHAPESQIALLRTLIEDMKWTIADLRRREDDLKADRDAWREAHSASQRLLPKPTPEDAQAGRMARPWWRRLAGCVAAQRYLRLRYVTVRWPGLFAMVR